MSITPRTTQPRFGARWPAGWVSGLARILGIGRRRAAAHHHQDNQELLVRLQHEYPSLFVDHGWAERWRESQEEGFLAGIPASAPADREPPRSNVIEGRFRGARPEK